MSLKNVLRQQLLSKRQALDEAIVNTTSTMICQQLSQLISARQAQHVAIYWPIKQEVDPRALLTNKKLQQVNFYLPKIAEQSLQFFRFQGVDQLHVSTFGCLEPAPNPALEIFPHQLDLVVVPGVAFTKSGQRLGWGKGYYDRCFARSKEQKQDSPYLVGVAYTWQVLDELPMDPWDVVLDEVIYV